MGLTTSTSESSHWYTVDGLPRFDATLREARKEHLLPSITTVEYQEITTHNLYAWSKEQLIMSALTLPRGEEESMDDFAKRVVEDSQAHRSQSADMGIIIHKLIREHISCDKKTPWDSLDKRVQGIIIPVWKWIDDNINYVQYIPLVEYPCANLMYGYAGTLDFAGFMKDGRLAIIDWKTQWTKGGKPQTYDTWAIQLAAQLHLVKADVCANLVISTREYGLIDLYEWPEEEIERSWEIFKCALRIFQLRRKLVWNQTTKQYNPR